VIFGATTGPIGTNLDGIVYWIVSKEIISFAIGNAQKEQEAPDGLIKSNATSNF
jgi:hypothetical protein